MIINRCFGCMESLRAYPCPHCGYDPSKNSGTGFALLPGTILNGKYMVGRVLGQGGFGITYIGWDLNHKRKVAIKEFFPSGCVNRATDTRSINWYNTESAQTAFSEGRKLFVKEAGKMKRVDSVAQVAHAYEVFQENNTAYICMEFIEGRTLKEVLMDSGPMSWEDARKIFLPVLDTMAQVHKVGMIHRDFSPDNMMVQPGGGIRILDLGAAKDIALNKGASSMRVARNGFSPLEQYTSQGGSGTWTDVYAIAASLYYTLTGTVPLSAVDRLDNDLLRWDLPQLTALPPEVIRAMKNALALHPSERTRTVEEFRAEILNKPLRKKGAPGMGKWIAAAAAAVLVAAVGIGVLLAGGTQTAGGERVDWPARIEKTISSCQEETYTYRSGARMKLYFDSNSRELARVYYDEQGEEIYTFLAVRDAEGRLLEQYGFEKGSLTRSLTYTRNGDGTPAEALLQDGSGTLLSRTEYVYDGEGRETGRTTRDAAGNLLFSSATKTDGAGNGTETGTWPNGETVTHSRNPEGQLLKTIRKDGSGRETARWEYTYTGGKRTGETLTTGDGTRKYTPLHGPGDLLFGRELTTGEEAEENVSGVEDVWQLLSVTTEQGGSRSLSRYGWEGKLQVTEYYSPDGLLERKVQPVWDEKGSRTGSVETLYHPDGSYSVESRAADSPTGTGKRYASDGTVLEEWLWTTEKGILLKVITVWNADGSKTVEKREEEGALLEQYRYDATGNLVSKEFTHYENGECVGFTETRYHSDGTYTVVEKNARGTEQSSKTYDANGNFIR